MTSPNDDRMSSDVLVLHREGGLYLEDIGGELHLMDGTMDQRISSSPYEPATYLEDGESLCVTIHNAFDEGEIRRIAEFGGSTGSASGNRHSIGRVMRMLALAVGHGPEVDSTYLEGLLVAGILNEFEAFSPEDALHVEDLGFDRIPRPMIRLIKQIAFTDDGRLYLKRDRSPVL